MPRSTAEPSLTFPDGAGTVSAEGSDALVRFENQVVDFFVSAAALLGVPKSVAAIYGIIFASPRPLSFADIEARLGISKGSISQGLRVLREVGAIRVSESQLSDEGDSLSVSTPHNRELPTNNSARSAHYEPDLELRKLVARFLEMRVEQQLKAGKAKLKALAESMPELTAQDTAELERRLGKIADWHKKASGLLPIARTFLKLT